MKYGNVSGLPVTGSSTGNPISFQRSTTTYEKNLEAKEALIEEINEL